MTRNDLLSLTAMRTRTFRTSADYDVVVFDRLEDHERTALAELQKQRDFYGILRRRTDATAPSDAPFRSLRAVDRETALLLLTLREPGRLPLYVDEFDPSGDSVRRLVLDGFLEISDGSGFVSGRGAASLLLPTPRDEARRHRLGQISLDAIEYGAALPIDDRMVLGHRLYAFNRIPLSPAHAARYPDAASILDAVADDDDLRTHGWGVTQGSGGHWINFGRQGQRHRLHVAPRVRKGASYKLYVSPAPASIAEAFRQLKDVLEAYEVQHFKLAGTAAGLLRPDKLVAYFDDQETLLAVADRLAELMRGVAAHGVPFTAPIDADGLLSWGVDPPAGARPLSWQPQQSWRSWITDTLAGALIDAREHAGNMTPAQFAVQRLRLEGVDVDRWVPAQSLWQNGSLESA